MTTQPVRIGVDIDDVLYPWYYAAHYACARAGIANGVVFPRSWAPYEEYGCEAQVWFDTLQRAGAAVYTSAPIIGAVEALHRARDAGLQVHLITARGSFANGPAIKRWTIEWLNAWQVPHDGLHFGHDKDAVRVDFHVDDRAAHCEQMEAVGTPTWLIDRPYNADSTHPRRIAHVSEFVNAVLERCSAVVS